jgi:hypothetical protein
LLCAGPGFDLRLGVRVELRADALENRGESVALPRLLERRPLLEHGVQLLIGVDLDVALEVEELARVQPERLARGVLERLHRLAPGELHGLLLGAKLRVVDLQERSGVRSAVG